MTGIRTKVTVLAAVSVLSSALAGCGGAKSDKVDPNDVATIDMMAPYIQTQAPNPQGDMQQALEKLLGKKLNISWVANSGYNDKMNVVLASDKIPEVMVVQGKTPGFVQSAKAGAFWDLSGKIGQYPNLKSISKQALTNASIDGRLYGLPRLRDPMRVSVTIRKDWLTKLGLKEPETVDDLYTIAKAFTEQDPDGDGKKDTYGVIFPKWPSGYGSGSPYDVIETWFGAPNNWGQRDGKLVPGFDTPQFLDGEHYVKKLFDEHLVNPDFATLDSGQAWEDAFTNGKGGIIIDTWSRTMHILQTLRRKDAKTYGNYVTAVGNLVGPDGKRHSLPTSGYSGFLAISKQSVPTEAELDDILKTLDKLCSVEGQRLLSNGIEGRNYVLQDNYAKPNNIDQPTTKTLTNDLQSLGQLSIRSDQMYPALPAGDVEKKLGDVRIAMQNRDLQTAVYDPTLAFVSPTEVSRGAQLDLIVADARIKYLAGQIDENGLKAEIKRWHDQGGNQVADEYNQMYAKSK